MLDVEDSHSYEAMKSPGCSIFLPLDNGAKCYFEPSIQQNVFVVFPRSCLDSILSLSSTGSFFELIAWFLL